jgi:hypothetical protein
LGVAIAIKLHLVIFYATKRSGGKWVTNVPALIRNRGRQVGTREPILTRYERICFDKELISVPGKPLAAFICPGHPLLDATIDLVLERHRDVLKQGSVLVDENDPAEEIRVLVTLQHSIQDAKTDNSGKRRIISRRMQYVDLSPSPLLVGYRVHTS